MSFTLPFLKLPDQRVRLVLDGFQIFIRVLVQVLKHDVPGHIILEYVEEHPEEYLEAMEDKTDALVRGLEERERATHLERSGRRDARFVPAPEYVSEVPF